MNELLVLMMMTLKDEQIQCLNECQRQVYQEIYNPKHSYKRNRRKAENICLKSDECQFPDESGDEV